MRFCTSQALGPLWTSSGYHPACSFQLPPSARLHHVVHVVQGQQGFVVHALGNAKACTLAMIVRRGTFTCLYFFVFLQGPACKL